MKAGPATMATEPANGGSHQDLGDMGDDQALTLERSEQELAELCAAAVGELMRGETTLIRSLGPEMSLRIFGEHLVRRADQLEDGSHSSLMTYGHR